MSNKNIGYTENRQQALEYVRPFANRTLDKKSFYENIEKYKLSNSQIEDLLEDYNIVLLEISQNGEDFNAAFKETLKKPYIRNVIQAFDEYWVAKQKLDNEKAAIAERMHNLIDKSKEIEKIRAIEGKMLDIKLKAENIITEEKIKFKSDLIKWYTPRPEDAEIFNILKFEPDEDEVLVLLDTYRKNPVVKDKIVEYSTEKGLIQRSTFPYHSKEDKLAAFEDICETYKDALVSGYGQEVIQHISWAEKMVNYSMILGSCKYSR